jgi:transposase InsO family protein
MIDCSISEDPMIIGHMPRDHTKRETKGTSSFTSVENTSVSSTKRDDGCRQVIEELLHQLPKEMNLTDVDRVAELLWEFRHILSLDDFDIGYTELVSHRINTGDHAPVREALRRHPQTYTEQIDTHVERMLKQGVIEPCSSEWASNVVLVKKKDGSIRCAVDYRRVHSITKKDSYPLPRIDSCLDALRGSTLFSTLDLRSGYWQVRQDPLDADKTAFVTRRGCFRFKVLSFGLTGAPSLFQRLMDMVMSGLTWISALVYLDDIVVFSSNFEQHLTRLRAVFQRLSEANLKVRPSKCQLFQRKVTFLGYVVSANGIETDEGKIQAVRDWPVPKSVTEVRSFTGLCSYYRKFIEGFAEIAAPLHDLTKKNARFFWTEAHQLAFDELKGRLTSAPVLALPNDNDPYILDTDASDNALGVVLSQVQNGQERVIAYASRRYADAESRYCITRRELLAVVYGLRQFRVYLLGRHFKLRTDHAPLTWLRTTPEPIGQQGRWLDLIAEFSFDVEHRPGLRHNNADALSRIPCRQCGREEVEAVSRADEMWRAVSAATQADSNVDHDAWGPVKLREAQMADPNLCSLMSWLEDSPATLRNASLLRAEGRQTKAYAAQWPQLFLKEGVLLRRFVDSRGQPQCNQLIPPPACRKEIIRLAHTGLTGGHLGLKKTLAQVQRRAYWYEWRADVARFCRQCTECAAYHRGPPPRSSVLQQMVVGAPFERVGIDLTGPHPRSRNGFNYILTYVDHFSKWAEAVPLRNKETITVANALVDKIFTRIGLPLEILSDQGKEFDSGLVHELCVRLEIHKIRTSAYKPSTNGVAERFHRTLNSMMGRVVSENQRDWCSRLPSIMAAYRAARHDSTGYSPNFLVFGRELTAPIDLVLGRPEGDVYRSTDEYVEQKLSMMEDAHALVRESLKTASARSKKYYDLGVKHRKIVSGDWVWVYSPRRYVGRSPKWQRNYSGPFLVIRLLSPVLFVVQKSRRTKELIIHGDKLKPYLGTTPMAWTAAGASTEIDPGGSSLPAELVPEVISVSDEVDADGAMFRNASATELQSVASEPLSPTTGDNIAGVGSPRGVGSHIPVALSPSAPEFEPRPRRLTKIPIRYQ